MNAASIVRMSLLWEAPLPGPDWLETAAELAARLDAALEAWYLEDPNLRRLAAWPAIQEVCSTSGRTESLSPERLARELRIARERAERLLSTVAGRRHRPWRFHALAATLQGAVETGAGDVLWVVDRLRGWEWLLGDRGLPPRLLLAASPVCPPVYLLGEAEGPAAALADALAEAFGVRARRLEGAGDPLLLRRVLADLVPGLVVATAGGPWWHDGEVLKLLRRRPFSLLRVA